MCIYILLASLSDTQVWQMHSLLASAALTSTRVQQINISPLGESTYFPIVSCLGYAQPELEVGWEYWEVKLGDSGDGIDVLMYRKQTLVYTIMSICRDRI